MNELRISYVPDDEWMGKILVTVRSGDFAGYGEAWVGNEQVDEFAAALDRYPLPPTEPCILEGGHWGNLDGSIKPQMLVSLTIKPQGLRGAVLVVAKLEDEIENDRSRDAALFQAVEARFLTGYNAISVFVPALRGLPRGGGDAVLQGVDW
ncbi:MAG: hypothetical protein BGN86_07065 [Caulobacterales bacterium 68-7]|nr:MAG: hypothetical protein BGN86_07065 [Caulobacterales bacterium 68-7]